MFGARFRERSTELEWMDDPELDTAVLERTLLEIEAINRWLGGYGPSLAGLERLLDRAGPTKRLRILDVGTGGADTPREMRRWAEARGIELEITGIDLSQATIDFARRRSEGLEGIELHRRDLFELPEDERFDVVHAALVLHHFVGEAAVAALRAMYARAALGVVVNDLHRHPVAWAGIGLLSRVSSRNPMLQNDAPLSVLRAFSREELYTLCRRAGLPRPSIRWRPMFRWQVVVERPR